MKIIRTIGFLLAPWLCGVSNAQTVGYVKTVLGEASVASKSGVAPAQPGAPVAVGDVIRTASGASVGITLKDNTVLSFGPSTTFTLEEYLFAPAKGELKLGGNFARGTMHYVSGGIAHLKPEAVTIKTPTGIIGVRGTRFVAVVE